MGTAHGHRRWFGTEFWGKDTMNKKLLATLAGAALAMTVSASTSYAGLGFEPGETLGQALGAPLPEGLFFIDTEGYGRRDRDADQGGGLGAAAVGPGPNIGVNIPALVYASPITFYDTRVEFVYAAPFIHLDGGPFGSATNRVDIFNQAAGFIFAHDFGNNFGGSLITFVRPPSEHFRSDTYADLRASLSYTGNGLDLTATVGYTGTFGGFAGGISAMSPIHGISDAIDVDFTATKKFGKLEAGFVGYYLHDLNTRGDNSTFLANGSVLSLQQEALAVGGLVGYDFGRFTLQGYAVRTVISHNQLILPGVGGFGNPETKGFLRLIVPLYVAPAPALGTMVRARY